MSVAHDIRDDRGGDASARGLIVIGVTTTLLVAAVLLSTSVGALTIPVRTTVSALWKGATSGRGALDDLETIVWTLRIPRVLTAVLVGATLGVSGAAMQGLFRNPLADPYLLGVANGASLGATLAWMLLGRLGPSFAEIPFTLDGTTNVVPLCAFLGAIGAVGLTLALAGSKTSGSSVLLAGIVVGSILTSLSTYLMLRDADRTRAVFSWTLGNLSFAGWSGLRTVFPYAAAGMTVLLLLARPLDVLQLGDDTARTLGVRVRRVQLGIIAGASLATAAAVAFVGIVAFVGLIAPHIMRRLASPRHGELFVASALGGAVLLVLADMGARLMTRPAELPVGVVTTLLGGPFFLWLLRRRA
jgi:iron complex transport system permease protein